MGLNTLASSKSSPSASGKGLVNHDAFSGEASASDHFKVHIKKKKKLNISDHLIPSMF